MLRRCACARVFVLHIVPFVVSRVAIEVIHTKWGPSAFRQFSFFNRRVFHQFRFFDSFRFRYREPYDDSQCERKSEFNENRHQQCDYDGSRARHIVYKSVVQKHTHSLANDNTMSNRSKGASQYLNSSDSIPAIILNQQKSFDSYISRTDCDLRWISVAREFRFPSESGTQVFSPRLGARHNWTKSNHEMHNTVTRMKTFASLRRFAARVYKKNGV